MPEFEPRRLLVTGGAGFIGGNFIRHLLAAHPGVRIWNLDLLTYAGNLASLADVDRPRPRATTATISCTAISPTSTRMAGALVAHDIDTVVHFAAESHVDRSIWGPSAFVDTNVLGTFRLLEACREACGADRRDVRFHHVSTDEVFGCLGPEGAFTEDTPYDPSSPYSASKAACDHLVRAWHRTYGLPVTVTNCSNNYGPYQFPEKLIPLMILNAWRASPCRCTATARTSATGSTSRTTAAPWTGCCAPGASAPPTTSAAKARRPTCGSWRRSATGRRPGPDPGRRRLLPRADHLRGRPARARPPLRHRLPPDPRRAGLGAGGGPGRGAAPDRGLVPRPPRLVRRGPLRRVPAVLRRTVRQLGGS